MMRNVWLVFMIPGENDEFVGKNHRLLLDNWRPYNLRDLLRTGHNFFTATKPASALTTHTYSPRPLHLHRVREDQ